MVHTFTGKNDWKVSFMEIAHMFNKVGLQLLFPPKEVLELMEKPKGLVYGVRKVNFPSKEFEELVEKVRKDCKPPIPEGADRAILWAMNEVQVYLKQPFCPPDSAVFVLIAKEAGLFDTVRVSYKAGGLDFHIGQTRYVIGIKVSGVKVEKKKPVCEQVRKLALKLLKVTPDIEFKEIGKLEGGIIGIKSSKPVDPRWPEWPHWQDDLNFWIRGSEVAFLTLRAEGGPTKAVISSAEWANEEWFSMFIDRPKMKRL